MNTEFLLLLPLLGEWFAKGIAVLLIAASIVRLWRRSSAAQRHFVWFAALTTLLLLPATRLVAPRWQMSLEKPVKVKLPAAAPTVAPMEVDLAEAAPRAVVSASKAWRLPNWRILLAGIWGTGVAGLLGYRGLGSWRLWRIEKAAASLDDTDMMEMSQGVFHELGIRQEVTIRISEECRVPMTWGIRRAILVLPEEAREWSHARLAAALRHEAGHICRRDYLVRWVAHVTCALYWPNPLVWLAARSLRVAQEQATDDLVLRAGTPAKEYAAQLCDAARTVAAHGLFAREAVAMATPSTLESRVRAIVDERRDRRPLSRLSAVAGSSVVMLTLAVCTVAQLRGADPAPAAPGAGGEVPFSGTTQNTYTGSTALNGANAAPGQPQVLIEAKFMEITGDAAKLALGLTAEKSVYTDPQFQVILRALNQRKGVDLLSAPRVTTRSNQAALIQVGREFWYPTEWTKDAKGQWQPSTFDTKQVGVTLDVTPVIGADGSVELRLKPSVVDFRGFTDLDGPKDAKALTSSEVPVGKDTLVAENGKRMKPQFSERNLDTTIKLKSSETVALGALKEQGDAKAFIKDPFPRSLVIFVSATVITDPMAVDAKQAPVQVQGAAEQAAASIIIPKLEFREAPLEEAVAFLRKKSRELSPDGREINIVLKLPKGGDEGRITVSLTNIPLIEAVRYVASLGNLNLHIQPDALVLGDLAAAETPRSTGEPPPAARSAAMVKADGIIIPKLEFSEASPEEALGFLRAKAREFDPGKQGVNLILDLPPESNLHDLRITLSLSNIPLTEALKYVAELGTLEVVGEAQAIVLRDPRKGNGLKAKPAEDTRDIPVIKGLDVAPAPAVIPTAIPVPGKPGFVMSPYDKDKGYIDVRGFPAGTEVKDPYSGQPFLVPPLPARDAIKATPKPADGLLQLTTPKQSRIEGRAGIEIQSANGAVDLIPTRHHGSVSY